MSNSIRDILKRPQLLFLTLGHREWFNWMGDEQYLKIAFWARMGFARELSKGIPHVRVDFYDINGHVYFGELTFFHWSGLVPFEPKEWDMIVGNWITMPMH